MNIQSKICGLDIGQLALVHVTQYPPERNGSDVLIQSRFDGLGGMKALEKGEFYGFRNSVHTAINHPVKGHALGNWDGNGIVVVSPMRDIIDANGTPDVLNTVDTFWALPENTPLKMRNSVIIQPSDNLPKSVLFDQNSSEKTLYYKQKFTNEDRKALLDFLKQTNYMFGPDSKTKNIFDEFTDELTQKAIAYENASSEELFAQIEALPQHFQDIFDSLARTYLRNALTYQTLNQMNAPVMPGGMWAWADSFEVTNDTQTMAQELGCEAAAHTNTTYKKIEDDLSQAALDINDVVDDLDLNHATRALASKVLETPGYARHRERLKNASADTIRGSTAQDEEITLRDIIKTLDQSLDDLDTRLNTHLESQKSKTPPEPPDYEAIRKECANQDPKKQELDTAEEEYNNEKAAENHARVQLSQARQNSDPLTWVFNPVAMFSHRRQLSRELEQAREKTKAAFERYLKADNECRNQAQNIDVQARQIFDEQYKDYEQMLEAIHQTQRVTDAYRKYITETRQAISLLENMKREYGEDHIIALSQKNTHVTGDTVLRVLDEAVPPGYYGRYARYKNENVSNISDTVDTKGLVSQRPNTVGARM